MKYNILIILIISLFVNELRAVNCPAGTQNSNGQEDVADVNNCTHCKRNYFYNGGVALGVARGNTAFAPGTDDITGRCIACQVQRANSVATEGQQATLATQCSLQCPTGTVLANGNTETFQLTAAECANCKRNYFYNGGVALGVARGNTAFAPGTDDITGRCIACQVPLAAPVSNGGQAADLATQCSLSCPAGTVLADGNTETFQLTAAECVNCKRSFFYNGGVALGVARGNTAFAPGTDDITGRCIACQVPLAAPVSNGGQAADLATQCSLSCPAGTVLADGNTENFQLTAAECVNCKRSFFYNGGAARGVARGNTPFAPGTDDITGRCIACQVPKAAPVSNRGQDADLATQCMIPACPTGTVLADGTTSNFADRIAECTNCAADYYFTGAFVAGTSQCTKCSKSKATPTSIAGGNANIVTQCDTTCPTGTVLDDGTKSSFAALASECTKCGANFYTTKNTGFVAGTDSCTECPKKLSSGATAKSFADATQKVQCAGNFAKFLSISLLFISFYLL